jgi:hypothetical protein
VRHRHTPRVQRERHRLGVERVVLATVLTHPNLLHPGGVQHHRPLAPARQHVVHVPPFAARFESHLRGWRLRTQHRLQIAQPTNALSIHHLALGNLAISDVAGA